MKKVLCFFLISISFFLFSIRTFAATWRFSWENTTVHIPVGASIEDYKNIPKAKLFKDGVVLTDTFITYNTEGDWLYYFKDVNPYVVGEYQVWYKAYESKYSPGTCTGYKALITFVVEDTIPPTIDIIEDTLSIKRGSSIDLKKNVLAKDNYKIEELKFIESINTLEVGTYTVLAVAIDTSGNQTTKSFKVLVYEDSKPVLTSTLSNDSISIPLNGTYDLSGVFTATDSIDGDISDKIIYPTIDTSKIGDRTYTVRVMNNAGLEDSYSFTVSIVDDEEPVLELNTHSLILEYDLDFSTYNFKQFIKTLSDNVEIDEKNLIISYDLVNEVGSYMVQYSYTDGIYTVTADLAVSLVSKHKPTIEAMDIELYANSSINLYEFITVSDPSDPYIMESLEINDSAVDYTKEGIYYADVYCCNSSGLSSTQKIKIIIREDETVEKVEEKTNSNLPLIIITGVSSFLAVGLTIFVLLYFVFRKKIK